MNCLKETLLPALRGLAIALAATLLLWSTAPNAAQAGTIEAGLIDTENTSTNGGLFTSVNFSEAFSETPLVFVLTTVEGADPALLRVRNVTTTGFELAPVEAPGNNASGSGSNDGLHAAMTGVSWLAVTPGSGTLGGLAYEAGTHTTATAISAAGGSHDSVNFASPFADSPALITGIQSQNNNDLDSPLNGSSGTPWMSVSVNTSLGGPSDSSITPTGFEVALDRAETGSGDFASPETIGYFALERGLDSFVDDNGNTIDLASLISANNIEGWANNGGQDVGTNIPSGVNAPFGTTFGSEPLALASIATRDGNDGGWLRRSDVTTSGIFLNVDEDKFGASNQERSHTDEAASVVAFSQAFRLTDAVPEPSTLALVSLALAGLISRRRRR